MMFDFFKYLIKLLKSYVCEVSGFNCGSTPLTEVQNFCQFKVQHDRQKHFITVPLKHNLQVNTE